MRKITEQAARALLTRTPFKSGNTQVKITAEANSDTPVARMYLHGNLIAELRGYNLHATLAGWPTPTTRERLNGICNLAGVPGFYQRDHRQFRGEWEIDSDEWVRLK